MTDWENDPLLEAKIRQARIKNRQRLAAMTQAERDRINAVMRKSAYDKFIEAEEQLKDDAMAIAALIAFGRKQKAGGDLAVTKFTVEWIIDENR